MVWDMNNDGTPRTRFLCGPQPPTAEDLATVGIFERWLGGDRTERDDNYMPYVDTSNPDVPCECGHPWGIHDVYEYRGDGSEMCCVTDCAQKGCPGRRRKPATMCAGCTVKPIGHEGECYQ
jgi:hypothetical protein